MSSYSEFASNLAQLTQAGANAQARGINERGQIWGQAIGNLGQIAAQIPAQYHQQKIVDVLKAHNGDVDAALPEIMQIDPTLGSSLSQRLMEAKKTAYEFQIKKWEHDKAGLDFARNLVGSATDPETYAQALYTAKLVGADTSAFPASYDPKFIESTNRSLMTAQQRLEADKPEFEPMQVNAAGVLNKKTGEVTPTGITPRIANETELLVAATDPNSPLHEQAVAAMAAKQKAAPESKVGSFEDYVTRTYGANPTSAQVLAARKAYGQADDRVRVTVPPAEKLVKVEHKDPETGKTVIEWLPQSQLKGQKFEKGSGATVENRLASAEAVTQTGQDIISKLGDPAYAKTVGPVMGRYNSIRDWIGNPPPELSELAGLIESYSLANMGVHGMRSAQGAAMIRQLMESKQTPQSIISAIKGLNAFSQHYMQNEGRPSAAPTTAGKKVGRFEIVSEE